jgi:hypothetical protein
VQIVHQSGFLLLSVVVPLQSLRLLNDVSSDVGSLLPSPMAVFVVQQEPCRHIDFPWEASIGGY